MSELETVSLPDLPSRELVVVPLGATEQHGPHLPFGTDTIIAEAIAGGLLRRESRAVMAPPLAYGASGEHQGFPGTLSIGSEALAHLLLELARSATETFRRVLFLNAHGGNAPSLGAVVDQLQGEGRDVRLWSPAGLWTGDAHAGVVETSVMLALTPELVQRDRAVAGNTRPLAELMPELTSVGVRAVSETGILGDPSDASVEQGERLLSIAVDGLCGFVGAWLESPRPR